MKVALKKCTLNDLFTLKELSIINYVDTYGQDNTPVNMAKYIDKSFSVEKLSREIINENSGVYFMYIDDMLGGYVKLNKYKAQKDIKNPRSMEIEKIYILKDYQGKDIVEEFIEQVIKVARNDSKEFIWLGICERNDREISFYERNGFKEIGKHSFKVGEKLETEFIMHKYIK